MRIDGDWDPLMPCNFISHISFILDGSRNFCVPATQALQEALTGFSKYAGALLLSFATGSNSRGNNTRSRMSIQTQQTTPTTHNFMQLLWQSRCKGKITIPIIFRKISKFNWNKMCKEAKHLQSIPLLSLAAALVPPFDNL